MKRRPHADHEQAISVKSRTIQKESVIGLVLSGGGVRAAYQIGALRAIQQLLPGHLDNTALIFGSSIGAINGLIFGACLKMGADSALDTLAHIWRTRSFSNTFAGSPTRAFVRSVRAAISQYLDPGPRGSALSIFDPAPLEREVDRVIAEHGGLKPENRAKQLKAIGVMTTVEGTKRKPLLFLSSHVRLTEAEMHGAWFDLCYVDEITSRHGFGSAALPSVLPAVELHTEGGTVRVVDGGISQNVPVDPAARFGAEKIIVVDISGRTWWHDKYGEAHDHRPSWEVETETDTFCLRPPETLTIRNPKSLGALLKQTAGTSTRRFMTAVGPIWPMFQLVRGKLGDEAAYEVMSYVAMDGEYLNALMETGYHQTIALLQSQQALFVRDGKD